MTLRLLTIAITAAMMASPLGYNPLPAAHANGPNSLLPLNCGAGWGATLCTEVHDPDAVFGQGVYVGHDEPAVLYYSNRPGAGSSNLYRLTLPKDPPTPPKQDGSGGTVNAQLHVAFWLGMAMCDTQSAPEYTSACTPDSDTNIFDNPNPRAPDYMGYHPGTAFMEMQFYPPGWVAWPPGASCDATKWCAALNIDSLSLNLNTGVANNKTCLNTVGIEPVNFAFITTSGQAQAPADPVHATVATFTPDQSKDLFMNSGDNLTVDMHDTPAGFQVIIHDLTTGQAGSMTASVANQFAQVNFDPHATTCTSTPYAFHPMYATSSEHTRVVWAAHSYNVAFSDEIGHFEYCNAVSSEGGNCTAAGVNDSSGLDSDDGYCFDAAASLQIQVGGCFDSDVDFDGPSYQHTWPGTLTNPGKDAMVHPSSILFTSPTFNGAQNYDRVAFETDLPRIEDSTNPPCQRYTTGAGCVNPPAGADFYPLYTTRMLSEQCMWQLGGVNIPGTKNTFGGSSATEFGSLLQLTYPDRHYTTTSVYEDFRQVLSSNPCPA